MSGKLLVGVLDADSCLLTMLSLYDEITKQNQQPTQPTNRNNGTNRSKISKIPVRQKNKLTRPTGPSKIPVRQKNKVTGPNSGKAVDVTEILRRPVPWSRTVSKLKYGDDLRKLCFFNLALTKIVKYMEDFSASCNNETLQH